MTHILPESLKKTPHSYCPGCGHGIIHRIMAEAVDELGIREKVIAIAPVGCAVFGYNYWNFDTAEAAHGRPPAVATGIKRVMPENIVITYQGDGDLAAIGGNEIMHAANRGENITVFFVNNACYGMTGGQMAPTTLMEQVTTTTPSGRSIEDGWPLRACELLASLQGVSYIERVAVHTPGHILKAGKSVRKALELQKKNSGFSMVEFLSMCPTGWKVSPAESIGTVEQMMEFYPLGVYREP